LTYQMRTKIRFIKPSFWVLCVLIFPAGLFAQSAPFPNHTKYTAGTIKPDTNSQAEMDTAVEKFYSKWERHYIRYTKDKRGHMSIAMRMDCGGAATRLLIVFHFLKDMDMG